VAHLAIAWRTYGIDTADGGGMRKPSHRACASTGSADLDWWNITRMYGVRHIAEHWVGFGLSARETWGRG